MTKPDWLPCTRCRTPQDCESTVCADNAPTPQANQCDGCNAGQPVSSGLHRDADGRATMACQASRYAPTPQAAEPVAWIRDQRGEFEGPETLAPLFLLGWVPPGPGYGATYSPLYAAPQPAAAPEDAAGLGARVPENIMQAITNYGDARADEDTTDAARQLGVLIGRIRAALAASSRAQQGAPVASPWPVTYLGPWQQSLWDQAIECAKATPKTTAGRVGVEAHVLLVVHDELARLKEWAALAGQQAGRAARSDDAVGAPPVEPSREPLGVSASPTALSAPALRASAPIADADGGGA